MFHARCPGLSLSRDAFSRSHEYDKFVVALAPYTIQHWGDRPSHKNADRCRSQKPRAWISNLASCALLDPVFKCSPILKYWLDLDIATHHTRDLLARCGVEYNNKTS